MPTSTTQFTTGRQLVHHVRSELDLLRNEGVEYRENRNTFHSTFTVYGSVEQIYRVNKWIRNYERVSCTVTLSKSELKRFKALAAEYSAYTSVKKLEKNRYALTVDATRIVVEKLVANFGLELKN